MDGERLVFTEESLPNHYLKVVVRGRLDEGLLEALGDFVKRQRRRLEQPAAPVFEQPGDELEH